MIENNTLNKLELLRAHMLVNSALVGLLFYTLPIKENKNIKNIEVKNYCLYFNPKYIENNNIEDIIIKISTKVIQFYFECEYDEAYCFTISAFMQSYMWFHREKYKFSYNKNFNILVNKLKKINIKKSTIIHCAEKIHHIKYSNQYFNTTIHNLSYDNKLINQFNKNIINNIDTFHNRCQILFKNYQFNNIKEINNFFNIYINNFYQIILFLSILRCNMPKNLAWIFIRDNQHIFSNFFSIINDIYFRIKSFNTKEFSERFNKLCQEFILK